MTHGAPCWYELSTGDAAASQGFYGPLLGWTFQDAGMPDFSYALAMSDDDMVAGLMEPDSPMPEFWLVYFAVDDCDATAEKAKALGGSLHRGPEDIPGTGRFAIVTDPQGMIEVFNRGAERLLGYRAEEVVGQATPAILHDPDEVVRRAAALSAEPSGTLRSSGMVKLLKSVMVKSRNRKPSSKVWKKIWQN